jgi:hypothetical protein
MHYYDLDAFGEDWPEMEQVHALIHTNGPLDPELVGDMLENSAKIDVHTTPEMLKYVWRVFEENPEETGELCYFGTLDEYVANSDDEDSA